MTRTATFPHVMLGAAAMVVIFSAASVHPQSLSEAGRPAISGAAADALKSNGSADKSGPGSSAKPAADSASSSGSFASGSSATGSPTAEANKDKTGAGAKGGDMSMADRNLMREMAQANLAEIAAAKLAMEKSQSEDVKQFAQKMVDDHSKAQEELQQLAKSKGVSLPTAPDQKHQAMMKKLSAMSGEEFDRAYMAEGGVQDHRATHRLLQRAETRAQDLELKVLAAKHLPVVDRHLSTAQEMHGDKASTATGASGTAGASAAGKGAGESGKDDKPGAAKSGSSDKQEK